MTDDGGNDKKIMAKMFNIGLLNAAWLQSNPVFMDKGSLSMGNDDVI